MINFLLTFNMEPFVRLLGTLEPLMPYLINVTILYLIWRHKEKIIQFANQARTWIKRYQAKKNLLPYAAGLLFLSFLLINLRYFFASSEIFSSDDPAVHLTVIKSLVEGKSLDYYYFPNQHYSLPVFYIYYLVAWLAKLLGVSYLVLMKWTIVFIYTMIPFLAVALVYRRLGLLWSGLVVFVINFSFVTQGLFWSGNFNQIIGLAMALLVFNFLQRVEQGHNLNVKTKAIFMSAALILSLLTYKMHNLTFFYLFIVLAVHYLSMLSSSEMALKKKIALMAASVLVFPILFLKSPTNFALYTTGLSIKNVFWSINASYLEWAVFLMFFAGLFLVKKYKLLLLGHVTVASVILTTAGNTKPAFYPDRLFIYAFILASLVGFLFLKSLVFRLTKDIVLAAFIVIIIGISVFPTISRTSLTLRDIYNSEAAIPALIPMQDLIAMKWIKNETEEDAIIGAAFKWGEYIPLYADRRVVYYPDAVFGFSSAKELKRDIHDMMAGSSSEEAYRAAKNQQISYIMWGYQLGHSNNSYFKSLNYRDNFQDRKYFIKAYDKYGVQIYKVK